MKNKADADADAARAEDATKAARSLTMTVDTEDSALPNSTVNDGDVAQIPEHTEAVVDSPNIAPADADDAAGVLRDTKDTFQSDVVSDEVTSERVTERDSDNGDDDDDDYDYYDEDEHHHHANHHDAHHHDRYVIRLTFTFKIME